MSMEHAVLSASGASRWLACTTSVFMERHADNGDESSEYAREGTLAHSYSEAILRHRLGIITDEEYESNILEFKNHVLYGGREMDKYVLQYVEYVWAIWEKALSDDMDAFIRIEDRVYFDFYVPDGFGTSDATVVTPENRHINVIDLKYGRGVQVSAIDNPQLKLYALGVLQGLGDWSDFDTVTLHVVQPRTNNFSMFTIEVPDLIIWAEETVKVKAQMAIKGKGYPVAGDHCRWCKAKAQCKALGDYANTIAKEEFREFSELSFNLLTDDQILEYFSKIKTVELWIKAISEHVFSEAYKGKHWEGYKLVKGGTRRSWDKSKLPQIVSTLSTQGLDQDQIFNTKLKSISDIASEVTVDFFDEKLGQYLLRSDPKPKLVPESANGEIWDPTESAADDFSGL